MDSSMRRSALEAAQRVVSGHGLRVGDAVILQDSNRLTVHFNPPT
ncbi:MAG: hypothetical protein ACR2N9_02695 [Acidimicrobiia bacterium]